MAAFQLAQGVCLRVVYRSERGRRHKHHAAAPVVWRNQQSELHSICKNKPNWSDWTFPVRLSTHKRKIPLCRPDTCRIGSCINYTTSLLVGDEEDGRYCSTDKQNRICSVRYAAEQQIWTSCSFALTCKDDNHNNTQKIAAPENLPHYPVKQNAQLDGSGAGFTQAEWKQDRICR